MAENEYLSQNSNRKRIKQPVSVPFLWEEKPGIPKKQWKPNPGPIVAPTRPPPPPPVPVPVKLIASVPFNWEETPGKPLPSFFPKPPPPPPQGLPLLLLPPLPPQDAAGDEMFESYLDAWGFETDDDSYSDPSLLANPLTTQTPSSPAASESGSTSSGTSSYATGTTSLVGAPFLERLFPLLSSPKSSFLKRVECSEDKGTTTNDTTQTQIMPTTIKDFEGESNCRRPLTLGELILMSRRRSYHRKAALMRDHSLSMEFMKKSGLGCCIVGAGSNKIKGIQGKWKRQLQLMLT